MEEAIREVFSAGFDIRKNICIGKRKMDYTAYRYDQQGRTLAFSHKAVDTYTTHENAYVFHQKLNAETFRKDMDEIVSDIYPTLKMEKDHYETLIDLIIFTPLDDRLMDMIRKYQKTRLLAFGLKGAVTSRLIAIDTENRNIAGSSSAKQLQRKLEGVFLK